MASSQIRDVQMTFDAAFDRLHRDMRVVLREPDATFDAGVRDLMRRRLLRVDEEEFLDGVRSLRNFLAHSHDLVAQQLVRIEIEFAVIDRLIAIADRLARRVATIRYMVPWSRVRCGSLDEPVEPLMAEMIARDLSHIPVVVDSVVTCIFDERVMFRALSSDRLDAVTPDTLLRDIVEVGEFLRAAPSEAGVLFVARRASLADLREMISRAGRNDDRISLIIVTESGEPRQNPLGLVTIWDLPGHA